MTNLPAGDSRHGMNGYSNLGCRCEVCRTANNAYNRQARELRQYRIEKDPSIASHGRESTYFNYKCRCAACTEAHRVAQVDRNQRRRARDEEASNVIWQRLTGEAS